MAPYRGSREIARRSPSPPGRTPAMPARSSPMPSPLGTPGNGLPIQYGVSAAHQLYARLNTPAGLRSPFQPDPLPATHDVTDQNQQMVMNNNHTAMADERSPMVSQIPIIGRVGGEVLQRLPSRMSDRQAMGVASTQSNRNTAPAASTSEINYMHTANQHTTIAAQNFPTVSHNPTAGTLGNEAMEEIPPLREALGPMADQLYPMASQSQRATIGLPSMREALVTAAPKKGYRNPPATASTNNPNNAMHMTNQHTTMTDQRSPMVGRTSTMRGLETMPMSRSSPVLDQQGAMTSALARSDLNAPTPTSTGRLSNVRQLMNQDTATTYQSRYQVNQREDTTDGEASQRHKNAYNSAWASRLSHHTPMAGQLSPLIDSTPIFDASRTYGPPYNRNQRSPGFGNTPLPDASTTYRLPFTMSRQEAIIDPDALTAYRPPFTMSRQEAIPYRDASTAYRPPSTMNRQSSSMTSVVQTQNQRNISPTASMSGRGDGTERREPATVDSSVLLTRSTPTVREAYNAAGPGSSHQIQRPPPFLVEDDLPLEWRNLSILVSIPFSTDTLGCRPSRGENGVPNDNTPHALFRADLSGSFKTSCGQRLVKATIVSDTPHYPDSPDSRAIGDHVTSTMANHTLSGNIAAMKSVGGETLQAAVSYQHGVGNTQQGRDITTLGRTNRTSSNGRIHASSTQQNRPTVPKTRARTRVASSPTHPPRPKRAKMTDPKPKDPARDDDDDEHGNGNGNGFEYTVMTVTVPDIHFSPPPRPLSPKWHRMVNVQGETLIENEKMKTKTSELNIFQKFLNFPELMMTLATHLRVQELISLYSISKGFHDMVNERVTTSIVGQAKYRAPESAVIFPFRCYAKLCTSDPAQRPHPVTQLATEGAVRDVPSFRWLKMVCFRDMVCHEIMVILNDDETGLPAYCELVLKKIWFLMDIPDNMRRIGVIQNTELWSDEDLFHANMLFLRMDLRLTDPVGGGGTGGMRRLLMAQPTLSLFWRTLNRTALVTRLSITREYVRWSYTVQPHEEGLDLFGIPANEIGGLQYEGWGRQGRDTKLQRPDELVVKECLRRGINTYDRYMDMFLWNPPDERAVQNDAVARWDRALPRLEGLESELRAASRANADQRLSRRLNTD